MERIVLAERLDRFRLWVRSLENDSCILKASETITPDELLAGTLRDLSLTFVADSSVSGSSSPRIAHLEQVSSFHRWSVPLSPGEMGTKA